MNKPAVFLDRDGTLIEERSYIVRPEQVRLLPGAGEAVRLLRAAGFACVVVTNQSAIGRGLITEADLHQIHAEMHDQLRQQGSVLDGLYYCPVAPTTKDPTLIEHPDRKPGPGMLLQAARELNLDLSASWMVGDTIGDVLAGRHAGCRGSILVRTGHAVAETIKSFDYLLADNLAQAAAWIIKVSKEGSTSTKAA